MKKYNCNNTLDYVHESIRICRTFNECSGCPLAELHCELYEITPEHIRCVQEWSDNHPETVLTDEQRKILGALDLLGLRYIAKDRDGSIFVHVNCPKKSRETWGRQSREPLDRNGEYLKLELTYFRAGIFDTISPLVAWSDEEPLDIEEVLKNGEKLL